MKILHIGKYYPPALGGIEYFLRDLACEQAKVGHKVKVLCHQEQRSIKGFWEKREGIDIHRTGTWGTLVYAPISPSFPKAIYKIMKSFVPDVLHIHMPNLSAFWILRFVRFVPIVIHWHSDVITSNQQRALRLLYPGYKVFERKLLRKAYKIIVTSKEYLNASTPLQEFKSKCIVIPLGISPARMTNIQDIKFPNREIEFVEPLKNLYKAKFIVFSAGRFTYYKGFEYLVRAAELLPQVKFLLAGNGPLWPKLHKMCQLNGRLNNVSLLSQVSDQELHYYLSQCDLFCLPSVEKTEAFGLVLLEAMYYGKPLLTTNVHGSGIKEVNIHNYNGLVVEPRSEREIARGVEEFLLRPEFKKNAGENSKKRLFANFLISDVAKNINHIYQDIK